jgi:putative ubiquitin-RnfH superfamily antitoxin RatB of RatAB toxin-antitoxin module
MAQIIRLKRSNTANSKPTTSELAIGELAINVDDGKVFLRKSGSNSGVDVIKEFVTLDHEGVLTGSFSTVGTISASAFQGDGSQLTNISVSQNATVKQSFTNSDTWSVEHNLDTPNAIVQIYDSSDFQIIPSTLQIIDNDNVRATFSTNQSGYAVVARGGQIVSGSIEADNISGLDDKVLEEINQAGVFSGSAQITLSGDVTGTGNATVISTVDGETF